MALSVFDKLKRVKHLIFDVDGVLTDSQLLLTEEGHMLRSMNTRDGLGIKKALGAGYSIAIITGGSSNGVRIRLSKLGVSNIHSGIKDKKEILNTLKTQHNWETEDILYMGDDCPDFPVMKEVGCAACPNDAIAEIKAISDYISPLNGGHGCVRDVIEKVLKLNGDWYAVE